MTEPILSREEISAIAAKFGIGPHSANDFARELLAKACGEPIYQIAFSDEDGWCDTHKKCYDEHPEHVRRIVYALNTNIFCIASTYFSTTAKC
ncbi:hypothetical protein P4G95_08940 [Burkholderia vietnamiensis]|uniref:hypothetical protein n=1 Tax=Burkholderia vietnamiensis TaxID=60552 RepID=UPI00159364AA|nr:hypothetical protein [Burkholderia vietnamiensis]WHU91003.1 hypothetical protein P4G95_08940 [Burkholderia vietnamiensis]